ncbi:MAG: hypothetical protein SFW67_18680 [Myxococcaceae bacterium]|nr:hypothetical protein [Myxococcaceae bacterium]
MTKGVNCANTLRLIREQFPTFERSLAGLPPESRLLLSRPIVAFDQVPLAAWIPVVEWAIDAVERDEAAVTAMARRWCDADFTGVYRFFVRLGSPTFLLGRAAQVWRTYYDVGALTVSRGPDEGARQGATLSLTDFVPWPAFGSLFQGFIEQIVVLTGGHDVQVHRTSRQSGHFDYTLSYRP